MCIFFVMRFVENRVLTIFLPMIGQEFFQSATVMTFLSYDKEGMFIDRPSVLGAMIFNITSFDLDVTVAVFANIRFKCGISSIIFLSGVFTTMCSDHADITALCMSVNTTHARFV